MDKSNERKRELGNNYWTSSSTSDVDFTDVIESKVQEAPRTVGEVYDKAGKPFGKSRFQVENTMKSMAMSGKLKTRKPKEKASRIFYKADY